MVFQKVFNMDLFLGHRILTKNCVGTVLLIVPPQTKSRVRAMDGGREQ